MDPISLAIAGIGLGMQIFGGIGQMNDAKEASNISKDEAKQEQAISDQKQQAMEIDANRRKTEAIRTGQLAASMATQAATNQGAQFGSGLQGGLAQVSDQTGFNILGVNQSLMTGRNIAADNRNISSDKYKMADVQSDSTTQGAITSLGGALMKVGPTVGALGKTGLANAGSLFMGGGSPSGYGR